MRHDIGENVRPEHVRARGERFEVPLAIRLAFEPIAKVSVVRGNHHEAPVVVEPTAQMR